VFEESKEKLAKTVKHVEEVSNPMGTTLGLKRRAVAHVVGGRAVQGGSIPLTTGRSRIWKNVPIPGCVPAARGKPRQDEAKTHEWVYISSG